MGNKALTISEALFEELCKLHNITCRRLKVRTDGPQPDYELTLAGTNVVAEVKQIDPNEEDQQFAMALESDGNASQCRNPDVMAKRVRNHIKQSRAQFNAYLDRHPQTPTLLVLFDAARNKYTDPYTIQTAMYGWEQVTLNVPPVGQPITIVDCGFAERNNREVRHNKNTHLGALATLHECWSVEEPHERFLSLRFYHNSYASHRIMPTWWTGDHIHHLHLSAKVPGEHQNWIPAITEGDPDSFTGGEK